MGPLNGIQDHDPTNIEAEMIEALHADQNSEHRLCNGRTINHIMGALGMTAIESSVGGGAAHLVSAPVTQAMVFNAIYTISALASYAFLRDARSRESNSLDEDNLKARNIFCACSIGFLTLGIATFLGAPFDFGKCMEVLALSMVATSVVLAVLQLKKERDERLENHLDQI
jgi:hypothetical protein